MFTGIVEETGIVKSIRQGSKSSVLTISANRVVKDLKIGDSINTNGVCLTVTTFTGDSFTADLMHETIRRTNLFKLKPGDPVNLERALLLSKPLGGHLVNGHVDGVGTINRIWEEDNSIWIRIQAHSNMLKYIVEKGCVAIDGISLTVVKVDDSTFEVSLIPHTQQITTLVGRKPGDSVNIECDILAKYTEKLLKSESPESKITLDFLAKNDFL